MLYPSSDEGVGDRAGELIRHRFCHSTAAEAVYCSEDVASARHYCDNLSRYFIAISFSLSFYRIIFFPLVIDLSVSQYFWSKISDNDNKIQQVIEKQFHT